MNLFLNNSINVINRIIFGLVFLLYYNFLFCQTSIKTDEPSEPHITFTSTFEQGTGVNYSLIVDLGDIPITQTGEILSFTFIENLPDFTVSDQLPFFVNGSNSSDYYFLLVLNRYSGCSEIFIGGYVYATVYAIKNNNSELRIGSEVVVVDEPPFDPQCDLECRRAVCSSQSGPFFHIFNVSNLQFQIYTIGSAICVTETFILDSTVDAPWCNIESTERKIRNNNINLGDSYSGNLVLFPNPVNETLYYNGINIKLIESVTIYNSIGKEVLSVFSSSGSTPNEILVKNLLAGVYVINFKLKESFLSSMFIKVD